jgi:hypothetical protein
MVTLSLVRRRVGALVTKTLVALSTIYINYNIISTYQSQNTHKTKNLHANRVMSFASFKRFLIIKNENRFGLNQKATLGIL